jgi:F0F1-type ATP synthase assembly protein I
VKETGGLVLHSWQGACVDLQDPSKKDSNPRRQIAIALELPFLLVGPAVVLGGIGFFLDRWLHTKPWIMLVLGLCGVALGLRDTLKAASRGDKNGG